jgi:hypothetical protein
MSTSTKVLEVRRNAELRQGLPRVFGKSATIQIQGEEVKVTDILTELDTLDSNAKAVDEANGNYHKAVATEGEARARARPRLMALRVQLQARLSPEELATCGLAPKKKARALTADERTVKTAKLRATREASGTHGARQVRAVKAKAALTAAFAPKESGGAPNAPSTSGGHDGGGSGAR